MGEGVRSHLVDCVICGRRYRQTNLIKRWVHPETLDVWPRGIRGIGQPNTAGYQSIDTHIFAHWRRGERAALQEPVQ